VEHGEVSVDMERVRQRKRDIVESFRQSNEKRVEDANVDLIMGAASFSGTSPDGGYRIEVRLNQGGVRHISAPKIFINTGARPSRPPIPGLDSVPALDSTSIMELGELPEGLLIIGGGYIGVEFGQMFRRFGSQVSIVQRGAQLLAREDEDVANEVAEILSQDGIQVLLESDTLSVEGTTEGGIKLNVRSPQGERTLNGSHLLLAVGRTPNTETLNLQAVGVKTDKRGYIPTNPRLETNVDNIYALGDVKGGPAFTHISYDDFRVIRDNLLGGGNASIEGRLEPYTVFMDPQLGRVGLSEKEARAQGIDYKAAKIPMSYVARALETDETRGLMKAIVDPGSKRILGAAILGIQGGEIMAMIEIAMLGDLPYTVLKEAIFTHPSLSESLNTLFSSLGE
jgi:pyruvate/2-oxoglutarate dehydrogenase complex dihydrolipoamide dehydrogenase (E3) component